MALKQGASVLKCPVLLATGQDDAPKHASAHGGARLIQLSDGSSLRTGGLDPARLERLAAIERWHFWFRGRQQVVEELLKKYLPGHPILLDIGCGTGWGLDNLARCGYRAIGLDMRPEGLRTVRQRSRDVGLVQADATRLPIAEASFAGIVLLDVMEHVDDAALLREVRSVVRPGGTVIISVPALPWLWSYRDEAAGHRRRYGKDDLRRACAAGGLAILEERYYQFLLLPIVIASRLLGRKGPRLRDYEDQPGSLLNSILGQVNLLEARLGKRVTWPLGTSLLVVCRR